MNDKQFQKMQELIEAKQNLDNIKRSTDGAFEEFRRLKKHRDEAKAKYDELVDRYYFHDKESIPLGEQQHVIFVGRGKPTKGRSYWRGDDGVDREIQPHAARQTNYPISDLFDRLNKGEEVSDDYIRATMIPRTK